ncbi:hypothetical protein BDZ45DRAFT_230889 [Acephala macrosclerotiorum]|nr:hypothetical protein BDZ45DRAFT_230889 [Acephala macrosclerotiorum]
MLHCGSLFKTPTWLTPDQKQSPLSTMRRVPERSKHPSRSQVLEPCLSFVEDFKQVSSPQSRGSLEVATSVLYISVKDGMSLEMDMEEEIPRVLLPLMDIHALLFLLSMYCVWFKLRSMVALATCSLLLRFPLALFYLEHLLPFSSSLHVWTSRGKKSIINEGDIIDSEFRYGIHSSKIFHEPLTQLQECIPTK